MRAQHIWHGHARADAMIKFPEQHAGMAGQTDSGDREGFPTKLNHMMMGLFLVVASADHPERHMHVKIISTNGVQYNV